jgi:cation diffusion facilitator family transporter
LLLLAAGWIAWQSSQEIRHPHHAPAPFTLLVLGLVVILKAILFRRVHRVGEQLGSVAVRGDAWHHRSDALTSAIAFVGISIALIGGEGFTAADDWAALVACLVIAYNGLRLLRESVNELMDASVSPELVHRVRSLAGDVEGVLAIEKCRVRKVGLEISMDIHVIVNGDASVRQGHAIAHAVKDRLLASGDRIVDVTVHIEPHDARHEPQVRRSPDSGLARDT